MLLPITFNGFVLIGCAVLRSTHLASSTNTVAFVPSASSIRSTSSTHHQHTVLFAESGNKYAKEDKQTQQELLQTLESKFDYEGRIASKVGDGDNSSTDTSTTNPSHRCALVTILGKPNMGKSTLLNSLLSDNLAIATSRPQTTRHAILGVMTSDHNQLCLTDTPGIIDKTAYKLQDGMMDVVKGAVKSADLFLVVTDEEDPYLGIGEDTVKMIKQMEKPVIVCVNKVDLASVDKSSVYVNTPPLAVQTIGKWRALLPNAFAIIPTCAANVDLLPIGPPLYHPDFFTDRTDRFCASELIRETLFETLGKELPYCCEVRVETFDESKRYLDEDSVGSGKNKSMIRIGATILVERDSQKGIVVGKGGQQIKDLGMNARKKLQVFFDTKIFLDLRVKVDKNWRNNAEKLKKYGYMQ
ncbi:predicted protein [Thalassiosira pseudonana CCMP1335]|uniref:KH type-2 domain-containing protein n=1 Tax=Thalassiosira pseudonana TaxID=35128 RepID=B8CFU8_THAPS|nr:predicted protein [Thalassiosira pseudonana CCMP1335]EED87859.1 predicted protein [Thalassiosira pseudonana CCMP1335]